MKLMKKKKFNFRYKSNKKKNTINKKKIFKKNNSKKENKNYCILVLKIRYKLLKIIVIKK